MCWSTMGSRRSAGMALRELLTWELRPTLWGWNSPSVPWRAEGRTAW